MVFGQIKRANTSVINIFFYIIITFHDSCQANTVIFTVLIFLTVIVITAPPTLTCRSIYLFFELLCTMCFLSELLVDILCLSIKIKHNNKTLFLSL